MMMGMVKKSGEARMPSGGGKPKTKKKTPPAMRSGPKRRGRAMGGGEKKRSMYMEGGKAHSGAQPTYGSTVADAMPKGMKN